MDRRQQKTRDAIIAAFTSLLAKKSYSRISVQEIIDGANVGRTTFYAHFETKDYLLKELCELLFDHIVESAVSHGSTHCHVVGEVPQSVFLHLIQHLQKNDNHVLELLSSENNDIFRRYFKEGLKKLVATQWDKASTPLPEDYLINHVAASFVESVDWWLSRGMKESPEQITQYFSTAVGSVLTMHKN